MSRPFSPAHHSHRRRPTRHRRGETPEPGLGAIALRVGSRAATRGFHEVVIAGPREAGRFARLVDEQTRAFPRAPIVVAVNGYAPWLGEVLWAAFTGVDERAWSADVSDLVREVQFAGTMQFPQKASERSRGVPWTFVLDHMNVPQVYYWSVHLEPPDWDNVGLPNMERFRLRTGVWTCGRGACRFDPQVSVTLIFTKPTVVAEHIVTELLFPYLYEDGDFDQPRHDEEGICWIFSRLWHLLTDWQNVIAEVVARLDEAEANSHTQTLSVKHRTRSMHREVDRLYEMTEYLHFHSRAFKKLQKLKGTVPQNEQKDPLWDEIDDAIEDLDQYDATLDGLKERFNNLIELEFNIQNAVQSDNGQFLTAIATLFLPISFLASLFGMTTVTWPAIWYLYAAIPVFVVSAAFTAIFPWAMRRVQSLLYPLEERRLRLRPNQFTMLGDELPDSVNVTGSIKPGKSKPTRLLQNEKTRSRSQARSRSRPPSVKSG